MPEDDFDIYGEDDGFNANKHSEVGGIYRSEDMYITLTRTWFVRMAKKTSRKKL